MHISFVRRLPSPDRYKPTLARLVTHFASNATERSGQRGSLSSTSSIRSVNAMRRRLLVTQILASFVCGDLSTDSKHTQYRLSEEGQCIPCQQYQNNHPRSERLVCLYALVKKPSNDHVTQLSKEGNADLCHHWSGE